MERNKNQLALCYPPAAVIPPSATWWRYSINAASVFTGPPFLGPVLGLSAGGALIGLHLQVAPQIINTVANVETRTLARSRGYSDGLGIKDSSLGFKRLLANDSEPECDEL